MRTTRIVAAVLLLGLLGTACGARLSSTERREAADAVLRAGGGGLSGTGPGGSTGAGGGALPPGASGATVAGATGGAGVAGGSGGATTKTGVQAGGGAGCPSKGTDVGLTSNSVTLGTIADTTGPVSGLFEGAIEGMQAFRAYVNSQGGICGRQVNIVATDDGTNCAQNKNATQDMSGRVFAFVGSFSLYDGCGADFLAQHTNIPDLHSQLDPRAGALPNHFDIRPGPLGYATGPFAYYAHKLGSDVKAVGTLYPNIPSAAQQQQAFVHAATSQGWKFVYSRAVDATENDWTGDFVKMCHGSNPIKVFFTSAENAQYSAKMVQNESAAGCPKSLVNIIPVAYDEAFPPDVGNNSAIEGLMGWNEYSLFFNRDEAQRIPELATLQTWFGRTYPGKPLNLYALFAWAEARLFQQAFESAGPTINRTTLLAALRKISKYDAHGIVAPVDPGSHSQGPFCYVTWQFHNGQFQRMDDPASGYRCDGRFLPLNG